MYEELMMNTSKHMSCFSDFPPPKRSNTYLTHHEFHRYLNAYATSRNLREHVQFNTKVLSVNPVDEGRRWSVTTEKQSHEEDGGSAGFVRYFFRILQIFPELSTDDRA